MSVNQVINILAAVTLIEMMITIGLSVAVSDVLKVGKNWGLVARTVASNYVLLPCAAIALLLLFHANPMVATGLFVVAACPGAPYGPPFTSLARGDVTTAVGLMVGLAASSAILTPLLLGLLLPIVSGGVEARIDVFKMTGILFGAQLLPLCVGLWIRRQYPSFAGQLTKPARALSLLLNLLTITAIIVAQFQMLRQIRLRGCLGMLCLVIAGLAAGRLTAGPLVAMTKSVVLTTAVRNAGVGLVIVTESFPGTSAIVSSTAYAIFQTIAIALVALAWGRRAPGIGLVEQRAA